MVEPERDAQATKSETGRIAALAARVRSLEARVSTMTTRMASGGDTELQRDLREVIHDVTALAVLAGNTFGEPFRSQAHEIVSKRQVT